MRFILITLTSLLVACSSNYQKRSYVQFNIEDNVLNFEIQNQDDVIFNDYIIFKNEESYISFSSQSTADETNLYGLSSSDLVEQIYGFAQPVTDEIKAAKNAILKNVIEQKELPHDKYIAYFHKSQDGTQRVFFTLSNTKQDSNTLYLIESKNRDAIEAFYGRNK